MGDDKRPWRTFPARQLTGTPYVYHAYVGRGAGPERTCGHNHRRPWRAEQCAAKLARALNAEPTGGQDGE